MFYILRTFLAPSLPLHNCIEIHYSCDYGVTYTVYFHELDSTYTSIPGSNIPKNGVKCYPNPASNFIQIDFQHPLSEYHISLFDMQGNIRVSSVLPAGRKQTRLDVSDLPLGIYLLKVMNNNQCVGVRKMLVNK